MADLPTCWYCPEGCGLLGYPFVVKYGTSGEAYHHIDSGIDGMLSHRIEKIPCIPPGTPLPVILDALGYDGHEVKMPEYFVPGVTTDFNAIHVGREHSRYGFDALVVHPKWPAAPATDEAHDG